VALAAVAAAALTTACEPPPPPPTLTVTTSSNGNDAVPGDGVCETVSGGATCTLDAAIQEANALGAAIVVVPSATYSPDPISVSGTVTLRHPGDGPGQAYLDAAVLVVEPGGRLDLVGVNVSGGSVEAYGVVTANRAGIEAGLGASRPALTVHPGGSGVLLNSSVTGYLGDHAVQNDGTLFAAYSTVVKYSGGSVIGNTGSASLIANSLVAAGTGQVVCSGTQPVSLGYNEATDLTCALDAAGDVSGPDATIGPSAYMPDAGDSALDAIPVGTAGCGTTVLHDIRGSAGPRPRDGNGDGTPACDRGMREAP
jgi:hypothetical protein